MVTTFVDNSIQVGKKWRRIRVLGGEPTVHPQFGEVMDELLRYRDHHPACLLEVVTNGHGRFVESQIRSLPESVWVENSRKASRIQPTFGPFNMAPVDDPAFASSDFENGCAIMRDCGMGLTPLGYYPCAVAGGIDRITGERNGRDLLPSDADDMRDEAAGLCKLCGRFRDGHFVPTNLRPPLTEERMSPTWQRLYAEWHARRSGTGDLANSKRSTS
jgi:hypothetical protein